LRVAGFKGEEDTGVSVNICASFGLEHNYTKGH
jgi:hypothetical protein